MKFLTSLLILFTLVPNTFGAEWYKNLPPGVSRAEILSVAGKPSKTELLKDRYNLQKGYSVELTYYENGILERCNLKDRKGNRISSYYISFNGNPNPSYTQNIKEYLKNGIFMYLPKTQEAFIRSGKYGGDNCYKVDDSFLVISPIPCLSGFFCDKTAKVILVDSKGNESVLYRAVDNWKNLKPPYLMEKQVEERTSRLRSLGNRITNEEIKKIMGQPDSIVGSGIHRDIFYLQDAMAVIVMDIYGTKPADRIRIVYPGYKSLTFNEWLERK